MGDQCAGLQTGAPLCRGGGAHKVVVGILLLDSDNLVHAILSVRRCLCSMARGQTRRFRGHLGLHSRWATRKLKHNLQQNVEITI